MDYTVKLDIFEGPLDLLIHLIKKSEMDIYDIRIAVITEQYLEYLDLMKELNINVAGEFLVMAATLIHIKSKMLLPRPPEDEDEEDPRLEIARPLMEYLRLKGAAEQLGQRPLLERDVFVRDFLAPEMEGKEEGMLRVGLFELMDAIRKILQAAEQAPYFQAPGPLMPLEEKMDQILELLEQSGQSSLEGLLPQPITRTDVIVVFLALLELVRLHQISLFQKMHGEALYIFLTTRPGVLS
jgi:segregation and condensation protein A